MKTVASNLKISLNDGFRCVVKRFSIAFDKGAVGCGLRLPSVCETQHVGIVNRKGLQEGEVAAFLARIGHVDQGHTLLAKPKQTSTGKVDEIVGGAIQAGPK